MTKPVLFIKEGNNYIAQQPAHGPWSDQTLHGCSIAVLIAIDIEKQLPENMQVCRISYDLFKPVPMTSLSFSSRWIREGKRLKILETTLLAGDQEVSKATTLMMAKNQIPPFPGQTPELPLPPSMEGLSETPLFNRESKAMQGLNGLLKSKVISGVTGQGHGCAWLKLPVDITPDIELSPLLHAALMCDYGNGMAQIKASSTVGFINADITLNLLRMPESEWICLDAKAQALDTTGIGIIESQLYDERGLFARVSQSIMANSL